MNAKHYVSLEVAKMLEKAGYDEECNVVIWTDGRIYREKNHNTGLSHAIRYSCPSLLEAMDWLEERGIIVIVGWDAKTKKWFFLINRKNYLHVSFNSTIDGNGDDYTDRNECMNEAIKTGVKLL